MEFTAKHMGKGRTRWYINRRRKILPEFDQTEQGREWRRRLQQGELTKAEWKHIPKHIRHVHKEARAVKNHQFKYLLLSISSGGSVLVLTINAFAASLCSDQPMLFHE